MSTVEILQSVLVGGAATSIATQILKSSYVPVPATDHPRITAAVVALVASVIAVASAGVNYASFADLTSVVAIFAGVLLVATNTYNQLIKQN